MIIVTGAITAMPETRDELLGLAQAHVERSRRESGCLEHGVWVDPDVPNTLFFFERWADSAALKAHFCVPESRDFVKAAGALAAGRATMEIYEARAVKPAQIMEPAQIMR